MQPPAVERTHPPLQYRTAAPLRVSIAEGAEETADAGAADASTADPCAVGVLRVRAEERARGTDGQWCEELSEREKGSRGGRSRS